MATNSEQPRLPLTAEQLGRLDDAALADVADALGLEIPAQIPRDTVIERIARRQVLIGRFDEAVLDRLLEWGGRPAVEPIGKYRMAGEVSRITKMSFSDLSDPALYVLASLRGVGVAADASRDELIRALKGAEGLMDKLRRKRRRFVARLVGKLIGETPESPPEGQAANNGLSVAEQIEQRGLVGGLAGKLRGAADDYVALKLDEIEQRIDLKLDEIDRRLAEWRDREIANRLRIIKITLVASVIVALISVIYAWCKKTFGF